MEKLISIGIKFAILREGYAQTVDAKFRQYVEGCRKNGIEIKGVYHFSYAINAEQAAQEAAFCIKQMEQAGLGKDVIVFYDFGKDYIALLPMDDIEAEDGEVYLYRYSEDENGQPNLENIEDDDEYEIVADAFDELLDEQEYDELVGEDELDQ